ncbi:sulfate transporter [Methylophaga sp. 42_8_T64]|nr:sulfate transporter [Methylophaga sp. 42_8_T64]
MSDFFAGIRYLFRGFALINRKGVRPYAYFPMAINTLLFSFAIWFGISEFDQWMNALIPSWLPDWLVDAVMWVLWPLFVGLLSLIVFFTFSIVANILAAPFNGALAEAVELSLSGESAPQIAWQQIIKDAPKLIFNEIRKLLYLVMWVIPLIILSLIPVLNIFSPLLWLLFSSWMLALDYHDYPMGNHQLLFKQQRAVLKQKRSLALGFGMATMFATMIPIVNFIVIPAAVAGATALFVERLKK